MDAAACASDSSMTDEAPFACNMAAMSPEQRAEHHTLTKRLVSELAVPVATTPDAISLSMLASAYEDVTRFIALERLCCPFLHFSLEIPPNEVALTLTLSGPTGAAEFIRAELGLPQSS
jgi:hypothetical protein